MPPPTQGTITTLGVPTGTGANLQVDNQGGNGYVQVVEATIYDGYNVTLGAQADAAATTDGATASLMALVKRLLGKLPTLTLGASGGLKTEGAGAAGALAGGVLSVGVPDTTASGSLAAANATVQVALVGASGAALVLSGTWAGTVVFELSADGGTTWVPTYALAWGALGSMAAASSATANGTFTILGASGFSHARVRMSAFTSGSASVALRAAASPVANFGLGVSGTPGGSVLTVQGISGGTALPVATTNTVAVQGVAGGVPQPVAGAGSVSAPAAGALTTTGAADVASGSMLPTTSYQTVIAQRNCGATRHRGLLIVNTTDQAVKVQINCHVTPGSSYYAIPFNVTIPVGSTTAQIVYITSSGYVTSTGTSLTLNYGAYAAIDGPFTDISVYTAVAGTTNAGVGAILCELMQLS